MARNSTFKISINAGRNSTTITYSGHGIYRRLTVNDVRNVMTGQPVFASVSSKAFWEAILSAVNTDIAAGNGGGT